ncbi:hypothetical protein P171DRAFT_170126 [Karstenula rhodostoma CBS 690.94]|uniref:Uncharacterized protein n=1 Tax=Karstenula rhodostoma CBS 690.94 TaxID=1392251 RepID=A0A9P4P6M8_9PLEO|nr:hypothetical protein P171DRAFT_170126 [Karstenula rhodostoma CBS 690.94]
MATVTAMLERGRSLVRWKKWVTGEAARPDVLRCAAMQCSTHPRKRDNRSYRKSVKLHMHPSRLAARVQLSAASTNGWARRQRSSTREFVHVEEVPGRSWTGRRGWEKRGGVAVKCWASVLDFAALGSREVGSGEEELWGRGRRDLESCPTVAWWNVDLAVPE